MPRIRPHVFWRALNIHPSLPSLVLGCRDLLSAQNELRWITEHVKATRKSRGYFLHCVRRRAKGEPLQYILGSEFFGSVEIKCRPGVLIPRPDTASGVTYLVRRLDIPRLSKIGNGLRVIDLCSGSGCIPILFHNEFYARTGTSQLPLDLIGVDISRQAIQLARENQALRLRDAVEEGAVSTKRCRSLTGCKFVHGDVFGTNISQQNLVAILDSHARFDSATIMTANPPYISSRAFLHTTARSVRHFEPRLALVPELAAPVPNIADGDGFYPRLIAIAQSTKTAVLWFEVADLAQAMRVAQMVLKARDWDRVEIWRDEPGTSEGPTEIVEIEGEEIPVRGQGQGRSVFAYIQGLNLIISPEFRP